MGGMCARVCPTEVLCEQACVRNTHEDKPVGIGLLQRYATDPVFDEAIRCSSARRQPGARSRWWAAARPGWPARTGSRCSGTARPCSRPQEKLGGLNEYGIAAYKTPDDFAAGEVEYILGIGGIDVRDTAWRWARTSRSASCASEYDAVFLGLGLGGVNALGLDAEQARGRGERRRLHRHAAAGANKTSLPPVGRRVVVIGGGMTAIDIAVQTKPLGAEEVTIVYRRGPEQMSASRYEQELAQTDGVTVRHWSSPRKLLTPMDASACAVETTRSANGTSGGTGQTFDARRRRVFKAIGQKFLPAARRLARGRRPRSRPDRGRRRAAHLAAGCVGRRRLRRRRRGPHRAAVQDGKLAALSIDRRSGAEMTARAPPGGSQMADLTRRFLRHQGAQPGPRPAHRQGLQRRARLRAGWGGAVWKTLGEDPPIVNVNGPRYGAIHGTDRAADRLQQHRADHRPAARGEPARRSSRSSATGPTAP